MYSRKQAGLLALFLGLALILAACSTPASESAATPEAQIETVEISAEDAPAQNTESPVSALAFAPDGTAIISGHRDGSIVRHEIGSDVGVMLSGHSQAVTMLDISPDGTQLASIGRDKQTILQSMDGDSVWAMPESLSEPNTIDFSPDGATLAEAFWEQLEFWPMADPSAGAKIAEGLEPSIRLARYAPDGETLAVALANTGLAQPAILHISADNGSILTTVTPAAPVEALIYSPDGASYVTLMKEEVQVWGAESTTPGLTLKRGGVADAVFGAEGATLSMVTLTTNGLQIVTWDIQNDKEIASREEAIEGVTAAAFSPDGAQIAAGKDDGTVVIVPTAQE
ncbi:MAG: WD40 repeat domain-containing protein [Caldilineaceae bacterium]|nr:WD40 repeat domain-containing protein [Caldilineaceae bacterium]